MRQPSAPHRASDATRGVCDLPRRPEPITKRALLAEAVTELGVDELVEALAHVANERGTGVIHIEQGPAEFAALCCGFDVIPDAGIGAS